MTQIHVFYCFSSIFFDSDHVVTLIIPPSGANFLAKKLLAAYALHLFTQFFTLQLLNIFHDVIVSKSGEKAAKIDKNWKIGQN